MRRWCQSISAFNNTNIVVVFGKTTSQLKHEWACLAHKHMLLKRFNKCSDSHRIRGGGGGGLNELLLK